MHAPGGGILAQTFIINDFFPYPTFPDITKPIQTMICVGFGCQIAYYSVSCGFVSHVSRVSRVSFAWCVTVCFVSCVRVGPVRVLAFRAFVSCRRPY